MLNTKDMKEYNLYYSIYKKYLGEEKLRHGDRKKHCFGGEKTNWKGVEGNSVKTPSKVTSESVYFMAQTVKASTYNVGDQGSIPGLGRSPGEGNGNPLQYPCLENPMD